MAIKKSNISGGMARQQMPSPCAAYTPAELIITHRFTEAVAAADILELAALPPFCKITRVEIISEGTGAATVNVGFMSGDFGSSDPARTLGTELFSAVTPTTLQTATITALAAIAPTQAPRSIGVRPSANIAANPATKLHMRIAYVTGIA